MSVKVSARLWPIDTGREIKPPAPGQRWALWTAISARILSISLSLPLTANHLLLFNNQLCGPDMPNYHTEHPCDSTVSTQKGISQIRFHISTLVLFAELMEYIFKQRKYFAIFPNYIHTPYDHGFFGLHAIPYLIQIVRPAFKRYR